MRLYGYVCFPDSRNPLNINEKWKKGTMEIRVCPKCNKAFYAAKDAESLTCTHCGHILYDRRQRARVEKRLLFRLSVKGESLPAKLMDYSDTGLRVEYDGRMLMEDTILEVDIGELNIHTAAKTVWTKRVSESVYASGMKFMN